jgi:hypothetical protein
METGHRLIDVLASNRRKAQWVADVLTQRADMLSMVGSDRLATDLVDLAGHVQRMAEEAWRAHGEHMTAQSHKAHEAVANTLKALVEGR